SVNCPIDTRIARCRPSLAGDPVPTMSIRGIKAANIMTAPATGEIDSEYATAMAARANHYMGQLAEPPIPDNFAVWFNYSTGASPGLKEAIDALIAGNRRFDAATSRELFSTFVAPDRAGTVLGDV